ncbi:hypothetical protein E3P94_00856 [Wallemia ichthyophaga]|nr:hypothetical protein E3P95_00724 [Wallemia ichthyophaga]TIB03951.1 hypothetical protein E3P94_00856 [Wallemia ichthyophaga]
MRFSPKRKTPPIDSASIESSLRLNGSDPSIRLVTEENDGLSADDRPSYEGTAPRNNEISSNKADGFKNLGRPASFKTTTSSNSENNYLTPEQPSSPQAANNKTSYRNISQSSLPRQSAEVTGVGEIAQQPPYTYTHSFEQKSMSANLTSSSELFDKGIQEKGLPEVQPDRSSKAPLGGARKQRKWLIAGASTLAAVVVIVLVIALPVTLTRNNDSSSSSSSSENKDGQPKTNASGNLVQTSGGDGSEVTLENGDTFIYNNTFGGNWTSIPFNNTARAQSYTKPLSETWDYNNDRILGVNLGGWLVLEPFIVPALYEACEDADTPCVDEYTLSNYYRSQNKLEEVLDEHYDTFITEKDFADIAAAGLNWVRLPIPFWMIETQDDEPFYEGGCFKYFQKAVKWARKYGLRLNLDLHAVPGSQNGYNHSGHLGNIHWMASYMGLVNAQRTLNYIRTITELITEDEYKDVVAMFSVINEPFGPTIGRDVVASFYFEAYNVIREITGTGEGKGPWLAFHDAMVGGAQWSDFLRGADRVALDIHPYVAFNGQNNDPMSEQVWKPCENWGAQTNQSMNNYGVTIAGEFSLAINDCGTVNGVDEGTRYEGTYTNDQGNVLQPNFGEGACDEFNNWQGWDDQFKSQIKTFGLSSMDALQNFFFWTWRIGKSSKTNDFVNPFWSYQLGLQQDYMTTDPHSEPWGTCEKLSQEDQGRNWNSNPVQDYPEWMLGGEGAGELFGDTSAYNTFPPQSFFNVDDVDSLPQYTQTGDRIVLEPSPVEYMNEDGELESVDNANGWYDDSDDTPFYSAIEGCDRYRSPYYEGDIIGGNC